MGTPRPYAPLGIMRAFSRMVKDASRAETPFSRVFGACYGYLMRYNLPWAKAVAAPVDPKAAPPASVQPQRVSKPDGMASVQPKAGSPSGPEGKYRSRGAPKPFRARFPETLQQSNKFAGRRRRPRSLPRAKDSGHSGRVVDKKTRLTSRGARQDDKGSLRDARKKCLLSTGAHVSRHKGCP